MSKSDPAAGGLDRADHVRPRWASCSYSVENKTGTRYRFGLPCSALFYFYHGLALF